MIRPINPKSRRDFISKNHLFSLRIVELAFKLDSHYGHTKDKQNNYPISQSESVSTFLFTKVHYIYKNFLTTQKLLND